MRTKARIGFLVLLVAAVALPAMALLYPLSSTSIREAYFIGARNDEQTADFFLPYSHSLPMPKKGPHVAVVSVSTPFSQVVERGGQAGYYAQEAEQEFLGKPLDFMVRVQIDFTATYPEPGPAGPTLTIQPVPDWWQDFHVQLDQDKTIPAKSHSVYLIYSDASANVFGLAGAILELRYDPKKIDSAPATIKVDTADGQHVETTFNLARLR